MIKLDRKIYDTYVGQYVMLSNTNVTMTIRREGNELVRQVPGWHAQKIFPESKMVFFNTFEDEEFTFLKNEKAELYAVLLALSRFCGLLHRAGSCVYRNCGGRGVKNLKVRPFLSLLPL